MECLFIIIYYSIDIGDTNNGITETIVLQESEPEPGTGNVTYL